MNARERRQGMPEWGWGLLVIMTVMIVFLPALRFPFFPFWDDDIHVHANPHLAQLSWSNFFALWKEPYAQLYIPLTYSVWAGLAALSRAASESSTLHPAWFHGANVLAHVISAILAFVFLRRTAAAFFPKVSREKTVVASVFGALFLALHPLQVEPVAWVSGLRDVLGGCLGLGALTVLFGAERPRAVWLMMATLLFLASLASKPAGVALPAIALILAIAPFRWSWRNIVWRLGPWFAVGIVWTLLTGRAQWAANMADDLVPTTLRPLVAGDALAFYAWKTLFPLGLAADYGRSPDAILATGWIWWTWIAPAALALALIGVKRLRIYLVPFGIFIVALAPMSGLVPFNFQITSTVADRYAYFALVGPALALVMVLTNNVRIWPRVAAALWVAGLALLSMQRLPLWSDDLRLFSSTLEVNPHSWKAMHNYASALDDRGRTAEAEPLLREVIVRRPDVSEGYNDLAVVLWKLGRRDEATDMMRKALTVRPTPGVARNLLIMEAERNNAAGMAEALKWIIRLEPENTAAVRALENLRAHGAY